MFLLQYVNKIYFDGELDIKTKDGLKDGMVKRKPISTDDPPMPNENKKNCNEDEVAGFVRPIKSPDFSIANPHDGDEDDLDDDPDSMEQPMIEAEEEEDYMGVEEEEDDMD